VAHGIRYAKYLGASILLALTLIVLVGAVSLPDLERLLARLSRSLGGWTYLLVGALVFLETAALVGLLVPGETAVVIAGAVAARGEVDLVALLFLVWLAAAAGDSTSFLLGRRLGRPFLVAHGGRVRLDERRLGAVERFYDRHGGKAVLLGRFVGVARAVTPFLAGASRFPFRRFLPYSVLGTAAWAALFISIGYVSSDTLSAGGELASRIALAAALAVGVVALAVGRLRAARAGRRVPRTATAGALR
jgi:membrane-associated protein